MTKKTDREAIAVFYKTAETKVGTDVYAHVQCFKGKPSDGRVSAFRTSAPFVLSRWYDSREVVLGSVLETLRNIRREIEQLSQSTNRSGAKLDRLRKGAEKSAAFEGYEREITTTLILVSLPPAQRVRDISCRG